MRMIEKMAVFSLLKRQGSPWHVINAFPNMTLIQRKRGTNEEETNEGKN